MDEFAFKDSLALEGGAEGFELDGRTDMHFDRQLLAKLYDIATKWGFAGETDGMRYCQLDLNGVGVYVYVLDNKRGILIQGNDRPCPEVRLANGLVLQWDGDVRIEHVAKTCQMIEDRAIMAGFRIGPRRITATYRNNIGLVREDEVFGTGATILTTHLSMIRKYPIRFLHPERLHNYLFQGFSFTMPKSEETWRDLRLKTRFWMLDRILKRRGFNPSIAFQNQPAKAREIIITVLSTGTDRSN